MKTWVGYNPIIFILIQMLMQQDWSIGSQVTQCNAFLYSLKTWAKHANVRNACALYLYISAHFKLPNLIKYIKEVENIHHKKIFILKWFLLKYTALVIYFSSFVLQLKPISSSRINKCASITKTLTGSTLSVKAHVMLTLNTIGSGPTMVNS